jgi:hypothetical protein
MWGTDWPVSEKWTSYRKTLTVVRDDMKLLNEEDKRWILSKTVERVWPFPSTATLPKLSEGGDSVKVIHPGRDAIARQTFGGADVSVSGRQPSGVLPASGGN